MGAVRPVQQLRLAGVCVRPAEIPLPEQALREAHAACRLTVSFEAAMASAPVALALHRVALLQRRRTCGRWR